MSHSIFRAHEGFVGDDETASNAEVMEAVRLYNSNPHGFPLDRYRDRLIFPRMLELVEVQTPDLCMAAVQEAWYCLRYVKNQTNGIVMAALQRTGTAIAHVREITSDMVWFALRRSPRIIFIIWRWGWLTPAMYNEAVSRDPRILKLPGFGDIKPNP